MAEKLELVVKNQPGEVKWDFEYYKGWLTESLQKYDGLVFSESEIAEAKKTHATLEKFKKELTAEMKRVKAEYVSPYAAFEKQVKELTGMVDAVNVKINNQIKASDEKYRQNKREEIESYFNENVKLLIHIPFEKLFNPQWLNKTFTTSKWQSELLEKENRINTDLDNISRIKDIDQLNFMSVDYCETLDMGQTLQNWNTFQEKKKADEERRRELAEKLQIKPNTPQVQTIEESSIQQENTAETSQNEAESQQSEEIWELAFRIRTTKDKANMLARFMNQNGILFAIDNKEKVKG